MLDASFFDKNFAFQNFNELQPKLDESASKSQLDFQDDINESQQIKSITNWILPEENNIAKSLSSNAEEINADQAGKSLPFHSTKSETSENENKNTKISEENIPKMEQENTGFQAYAASYS